MRQLYLLRSQIILEIRYLPRLSSVELGCANNMGMHTALVELTIIINPSSALQVHTELGSIH